jgi:hypothetical protein
LVALFGCVAHGKSVTYRGVHAESVALAPLLYAELVARLRRIGRALYIEQNTSEHSLQNTSQNFQNTQASKKTFQEDDTHKAEATKSVVVLDHLQGNQIQSTDRAPRQTAQDAPWIVFVEAGKDGVRPERKTLCESLRPLLPRDNGSIVARHILGKNVLKDRILSRTMPDPASKQRLCRPDSELAVLNRSFLLVFNHQGSQRRTIMSVAHASHQRHLPPPRASPPDCPRQPRRNPR